MPVAYAVLLDCPVMSGETLSELQSIEVATSHELMEAASDPLLDTNPTYTFRDNTSPWLPTFGEVGDMCLSVYYDDGKRQHGPAHQPNSAAMTNGSPCVLAPAVPFIAETAANTAYIAAAGSTVTIDATAVMSGGTSADWTPQILPMSSPSP